jgi:carboxyl-terminal processing protease
LRDGYGLKYTIARYYTPNGRSIQAQGIVPDITVSARYIKLKQDDADFPKVIKEKDLKNHLEAEPKAEKSDEKVKSNKQGASESKEIKDDNKRQTLRHGKIRSEDLLSDYQVARALDILKGYEILNTFNDTIPQIDESITDEE